jgi:hypothetical protein
VAFAARWAGDWLRRAARLTYAPAQRAGIVIGDASRDEFDPDAVWIRSLELVCARSSPAALCLPVRSLGSLAHALNAHAPAAIVLAGRYASDDDVARWAYTVRSAAGPLPIALYRRRPDSQRLHTSGARVLGDGPAAAQRELTEMISPPRGLGEVRPVREDVGRAPSMKRVAG